MLQKKESEFCCLAASLGNAAEAAYKAGFTVFPGKRAEKLLRKQLIVDEIGRIKKKNAETEESLTGLRRIAFGSIADAINLALNTEEKPDTHSLDLFSVSEIKYTVGKGVEIKFYDRLKALEKLCELENKADKTSAISIYEALKSNAGKDKFDE